MPSGIRHHVIQLVRQNPAHRTAEQKISSQLIAREQSALYSATNVIASQTAGRENYAVHFAGPAERAMLLDRRWSVHIATPRRLHYNAEPVASCSSCPQAPS